MIPLSHWLSKGLEPPPASAITFDLAAVPGLPGKAGTPPSPESPSALEEEYQRGRTEEKAAAEDRLGLAVAEERQLASGREARLAAAWAERCSEALMDSVATALARMQGEIEQAVVEALGPFLSARARDGAAATLLHMVAEVLADPQSRILEIRAPLELHDKLSELLAARKMAAVVSEADAVEVVVHTASLRFADMSAAWIAALRSDAR